MTAQLRPYPAYVDTGLAWLESVPEDWTIERAKWLFRKMDRPADKRDEVVTCFRDGQVTLRRKRRIGGFTEALQEIGYQGIRRGDLVIHAMDAFAGAIGVSDSDGKGTPVYSVCEPHPGTNAYYYAYLIREMARTQWILALAKGIRERSTDFRFEAFSAQCLPAPPLPEQDAMVRYLSHIDRRVRRFIREKQQLIKLLQEQRQAIVHRAVTRGVDPAAPLKPSGVPWLGDIPRHWEMKRAKQVCSAIIDCKNRTPAMVAGGEFTVVRTTNIRHGRFDLAGSYPTDRENYESWTQRGAPRVGDVFFTREAPVGEACLVPDLGNLCMGQRMMYFRPQAAVLDAEFLLHSIYGPVTRTYIEIEANGSTVGHLRLGQVSALPLLWCPFEEQRRIVAHIASESMPLNATAKRLECEIDLLREYRTRLFADVVTGRLDVREAAIGLLDGAGDSELVDDEEVCDERAEVDDIAEIEEDLEGVEA